MSEMIKVLYKETPVAIQMTKTNARVIADTVRSISDVEVRVGNGWVKLSYEPNNWTHTLKAGYWVVVAGGVLAVYSDEEFHETFRRAGIRKAAKA